ncbi:MAG: D-TA family PLP-dependent enzyme [Flavobacteriaceae bacterium]|nr:D-TA family PLP-dependent enzyme [Flavobacteriaceae bacterium]
MEWYIIENSEHLITPNLAVFPERIQHNIASMLRIAGNPDRLRPHIKTHKIREIVKMQQAAGITKFKCATIAEAEMLANCEVADILLAMQAVGENLNRLFKLAETYPASTFSCLVDTLHVLEKLEQKAEETGLSIGVFLDLNTGMNRTGILPGDEAMELYIKMAGSDHISCRGLHAYDGHIRDTDFNERKKQCDVAFKPADQLRNTLERSGYEVPEVIVGGSPTFPVHAQREGVVLSPGTTLLWDLRNATDLPDMDFLPAAVLLTRVVSKPSSNRIALDLGHKAIAPEMSFPRAHIMGLEDAKQVGHSEEHLVLELDDAASVEVGQLYYAIPMHICPTVCKYPNVMVVQDHKVTGKWEVAARDYQLSI